MSRKPMFLAALSAFVFLVGCAHKRMYYYGNYSNTLYTYEKSRNKEALTAHRQELEKVVTESGRRSLSVPPGIQAELGYIFLKENKPQEAIRLFEAESKLYPESRHLMNRLIQKAGRVATPEPPEASAPKTAAASNVKR